MALAILIVGVILIVAGLIAIFTAPKPKPPTVQGGPGSEGVIQEIKEALDALGNLLDKFEQRLRLGVFLVIVGAGLIGLAGYVEAKQAKDDVKDATTASVALIARPR